MIFGVTDEARKKLREKRADEERRRRQEKRRPQLVWVFARRLSNGQWALCQEVARGWNSEQWEYTYTLVDQAILEMIERANMA